MLENEWNGDLLDTIDAAVGHARSMTRKGERPTVIQCLHKTYEKGKEAMQAIEDTLERLPGLEKWFVDITPTLA